MEDFFINYWSQILTLVGLVWGYARLNAKVDSNCSRIDHLENRVEEMSPIWLEVKERLASIEATLKFLTKEK